MSWNNVSKNMDENQNPMDPQAEPMMPATEAPAEETTEATPLEENTEENA